MMKILKNKSVWGIVVLAALYGFIAWFLPVKYLGDLLEAALLATSIVAVVTYAPLAWDAVFKNKQLGHTGQLVLGITIAWGVMAGLRILSIHRHLVGGDSLEDVGLTAAALYLMVISAVLHITAPGAHGMKAPRRRWIAIWTSAVLAALIAGFVFGAEWGHLFI